MPKTSQHRAGNCLPMLFFHAAHLHAQMARLDDNSNTVWADFFLNGVRNLAGHTLLNLQAPRKNVHEARNFA